MDELRTFERWKQKTRHIKIEIYALYLAYRDPRVPWYAKALIAVVVGYAFSPIDLIPDFIPVIGTLDDAAVMAACLKLVEDELNAYTLWKTKNI